MAGTVLGKRSRHSQSTKDINPRHKKRIQILEDQNENESPYSSSASTESIIEKNGRMQIDLDNLETFSSRSTRVGDGTKTNTPTKINSHFKATKVNTILDEENKPSFSPIPQTPRHRDAISKQLPVTPRHRVLLNGRPVTPRTPRTPNTPSSSIKSIYNDARVIFARATNPGALVGRDKERDELRAFLSAKVSSFVGGCLYISGPPGTGKSALTNEVCLQIRDSSGVSFAYVNCMAVKNATDVYNTLGSELGLTDDVFGDTAKSVLQSKFVQKTAEEAYVVVLDEVDQLLNLDLEVLYSLFEWSLSPHSRLVLIGIANALDLTDRFLPRLKARNLKPVLLPFLPYSAPEIASVISARARSLLPTGTTVAPTFTPFLLPPAIQLISKKVAAQTGDIRKAFDITKRAIDLIETETRSKLAQQVAEDSQCSPSRTPLAEKLNMSSPVSIDASPGEKHTRPGVTLASLLSGLTAETAPRASIAHVVRVTASAFSNGTSQRLKGLNLQQKAVLCSLVALEQSKVQATSMPSPATPRKGQSVTPSKRAGNATATAAPTMRKLYETYSMLCKRDDKLHALSNTEFRDVIGNLETLSLVAAADGKGASIALPSTPSKKGRARSFGSNIIDDRRISGSVSVQELEAALEGVGSGILKDILYSQDLS